MKRSLFVLLFIVFLGWLLPSGCSPVWWPEPGTGSGGGQDAITVDLPFAYGYSSQCVQGPGGSYSHDYVSTRYDVDLDTPNDRDDPVFAPVAGTAYVHADDRESGFGVHVNVDLNDGTYVNISHLEDVFVEDGEEVALGQLIGFEGSTGNSSGDHVHIGRHRGSAYKDATLGTSLEGFGFFTTAGVVEATAMQCGLSSGEVYASTLRTSQWHPDGMLVKTPRASTVYLLMHGNAHPFMSQTVFWQHNFQFGNVATITEEELECYDSGAPIQEETQILPVFDGEDLWIMVGAPESAERYRMRVRVEGRDAVLYSWGLALGSITDAYEPSLVAALASYPQAGMAKLRDGALVMQEGDSTVFLVSRGFAMPIKDWHTFLLLNLFGRRIETLPHGVLPMLVSGVGDCAADVLCIDRSDVTTCGGPSEEVAQEEASSGQQDTGVLFGDLTVTWQTPGAARAERITLSGEYIDASGASGWRPLQEVFGSDLISVTLPDVRSGDTFRFSVEYEVGNTLSWSCLAPFPPGIVQGTAVAFVDAESVPIDAVPDPAGSDGCGLFITVP